MERTILKAPEGFIYSKGDNYGHIVYVALDADASEWELITEAEYEERQAQAALELE